ncbi:hypothetical protein D3C77_181070 [compost metagenome]
MLVATHAYRVVQFDPAIGLRGGVDFMHAKLLESLPVAHDDLGVHQRKLHILAQGKRLLGRQVAQQVRDHHVVAGQDAVLAAYLSQLTAAAVADIHRTIGIAHADCGAVQAQAHRLPAAVELAVVEVGQDDIFHALAPCYRRNQAAHQQACQRGVAIGEVIDVGLFHFRLGFFADRLQVHRAKTGKTDVVGIRGGHGVDAQGHEVVGAALKVLHRAGRQADVLEQEVAVAGAFQVGGLVLQ